MREEYDFTNSVKNPYTKQISIHISLSVLINILNLNSSGLN